jgi:membrane protein DedA with SNARE-associated domain/membrane-associated phospholipid phosphatase
MEAFLHEILDWVSHNPGWAYALVFLVGVGESLALVGMAIPGVVLLMGAGALIASGAIAFWPAFIAATVGAILGDGLSYSLGRHFDRRIRETWPFSRFPEQLDQGVAFFDRYGGWSVALGRFAGPVRAIVPLVAGMMRLPPGRFYVANVTSAVAQILVYMVPGMLFGASLKLAAEAGLRLAILGIALLVGLWLATSVAHRVYRLLSPHASALLRGLLRWADLHPSMGRVALALADPQHPDAKTLTSLAFMLMLGFLLVGGLTGVALFGPGDLALNRFALDLGQSLHTPLGNRVMVGLGWLGDPLVVLPMVAAVFGYLRWRGRRRHANYWAGAAIFALVAAPLLGAALRVPRPDPGLTLTLPWSFPSGPVLLATSVYGFLAISLARGLPVRLRWAPYALATAVVAGVAGARVYLGAEWLTDVLASLALGLAWISALGLAFRRHSRLDPRWAALGGIALSALVVMLTLRGWTDAGSDLARYTPPRPIEILSRDHWLAEGWLQLPQHREDLRGRYPQPLTLQYAGDPRALADALAPGGWKPAELLRWGNGLRLLSPSLPLEELPVIPQVHDGRHESLVLTQIGPDLARWVLRLWPTRFRLADGASLWVGNLTRQRKEVVLNLIAFPATDPAPPEDPAPALDGVESRLPAGAHLLRVPSHPALTDLPATRRPFAGDGPSGLCQGDETGCASASAPSALRNVYAPSGLTRTPRTADPLLQAPPSLAPRTNTISSLGPCTP